MATRLKRLDLHGFKSFASPTAFVFDDGITAVIGPNGSGKSNISDALRWVLGEQSYTNLRGRRTEDIIFAGSAARTPIGMAEATVTLDNEDGSLPVSFSEVSVTRRAYRSGENQYLINGARVRLKDVLQVTASLGQSHTVIGQGLVDAVLSQRVDERRGLFEHAAGITGLRIKHASAGRNLEESRANCTRLEDLLGDIEPRLRSLERAARQARAYDGVKQELRWALERYYTRLWRTASDRLREAQGAVEQVTAETERSIQNRDTRHTALSQAEDVAARLSAQVEALQAKVQALSDQHQRALHELALIEERQSAARSRRVDAESSLETAKQSLVVVQSDIEQVSLAADRQRSAIADREAALQRQIEALGVARQRVAEIEAKVRTIEQHRAVVERDSLLQETRVTLLRGQLTQAHDERARVESSSADREHRREEITSQRDVAAKDLAANTHELEALSSQLQEVRSVTGDLSARLRGLEERRSELTRKLTETGTRFETLKRLEESGVGLYAGVKEVVGAARDGRLSGVLGTLASLLVVPAELEAAIEAALGGHLQDLIVERWEDAESAIELLKRTNAGRATFHPLDSVRQGSAISVPGSLTGVRGRAVDLIGMDGRTRPIVEGLLGRTLVADDLDAVRHALRGLPPGWSVVTPGGELARSNGTVTGGSRIKETGALARERELRELPELRASLTNQRDAVEAELSKIQQALSVQGQLEERLRQELSAVRIESHELTAVHERATRLLEEIERESRTEAERTEDLDGRIDAMKGELVELEKSTAEATAELASANEELRTVRDLLQRAEESVDDEPLQSVRTELSMLHERLRATDDQLQRLRARRRELEAQLASGQSRLGEIDRSIQELSGIHQSTKAQVAALADRRTSQTTYCNTLRDELRSAREEEELAEHELSLADERCRELERRLDHMSLEAARRRDEIDLTLERAARDLEIADVESILSQSTAADDDDLPDLQREIARLRERLRRIGVAGDDAVEQYEREAERYDFLRQQLADVRAGIEALEALMSELDRTMSLEFDRTFVEVAQAFESTFTSLFGGGRARLIRCDAQDGTSGIDIEAQPPGKRLQNLGLLSGGERALTAVALLFSILKVNPSPFCLLDEVDAALDESNVVRFRDELQRLADKTQFVVVTHNRATIEGADTLYGITMGDDGVSRVLSLKLPAEATA